MRPSMIVTTATLALVGCSLALDLETPTRTIAEPLTDADALPPDATDAADAAAADDIAPPALPDAWADATLVDAVPPPPRPEETCTNGLDDDGDGAVDCDDPDCLDAPCDDGELCTYDDRCAAAGTCEGRPIDCDLPSPNACLTLRCDGSDRCAEVPQDDQPCDDADPCTHDDLCRDGACAGEPITCLSDACVERGCDGSAACVEVVLGGAACAGDDNACTDDVCDAAGRCVHTARVSAGCADDGNPCTADVCDGNGQCTHPSLRDGAQCGAARAQACCGGRCVDQRSDQGHCGGCGITCDGRGCDEVAGSGACRCASDAVCRQHGPTWTCYQNLCNCQSNADCPGAMACAEPPGTNYCHF